MHPINLSVAVWVGFIALFGIATNDGVIMGTYIHQVFEDRHPATVHDVREAVVAAGKKRVRPAMMTTAVAVIALLPVLTSTGKGADIMVPMSIPYIRRYDYSGHDHFCGSAFPGNVERKCCKKEFETIYSNKQ